MNQDYVVPATTRIGHVHLKVADLIRSIDFYCNVLGFEKMAEYGDQAVFLSAGGYHHHIGLNTWYSKDAPPAPARAAGLFHVAIVFAERKDLAFAVKRVLEKGIHLTGASDHGVSEAIYFEDPDRNGIELYWDRPRVQWPVDKEGNLVLYTEHLDLEGLLSLAE
jgi:catechol 2,3-dioxygenase